MLTFCYVLSYVFEQFIALMYFNSTFERKRKNSVIFICYAVSFAIQYAVNNSSVELGVMINILAFLLCNLLVVRFCYIAKIFQSIFHVLLLAGLMMTTELVVLFPVSALYNIEVTAFQDNDMLMLTEAVATKMFYFFVMMLIAKINVKHKKKDVTNNFTMGLLVLPVISYFIVVAFEMIIVKMNIASDIYTIFAVIIALLLIANLIVYYINEKVISTLTQNTELQLEKQRNQISEEYYQELEYQYNLSHILVHDIKKQLNTIKDIADEEKNVKISEYIASVYDGYAIDSLRRYSLNKILNVILTRYAHICNDRGIEFFSDIKNVDLSFISESDLTAIVDNLLENAFESALKSNEKSVFVEIDVKNEHFIFIKITNSCDTQPQFAGGLIRSDKSDGKHHGYGLRSVKRAVKKYNGEIDFKYDSAAKAFTVLLVFEGE